MGHITNTLDLSSAQIHCTDLPLVKKILFFSFGTCRVKFKTKEDFAAKSFSNPLGDKGSGDKNK